MASRTPCLPSLQLLLLLWMLLSHATDAGDLFIEEPSNVAVIVGESASLRCRVNPEHLMSSVTGNIAIWYKIKEGGGADRITHSLEDRFFIVGAHSEGVFDLFINHTKPADLGSSYICVFNNTTARTAILTLLPESWRPSCLSYPNTEVGIGDELEIVCTSDGDVRTELLWQRNGALVEGVERIVTDKSVSISHSEVVARTESIVFMCSATIIGMQQSDICIIGPIEVKGGSSNSKSYIPYIIVGLLSVIVSMLFLTLLVVLFRHRQCRVCQRELPEPQTVLDMANIQLGGPPPFYVIDGDDISIDDGIGSSPPPDVIPTTPVPLVTVSSKTKVKPKPSNRSTNSKPRNHQARPPARPVRHTQSSRGPRPSQKQVSAPPLRRTSSNATLQGNIDDKDKDKTVTGKKKLTMTTFRKSSSRPDPTRQNNKTKQSSQSQAKTVSANKRKKQLEEDAKSLKQLNIESKVPSSSKAPSTSNIPVSPDVQSDSTISPDTATVTLPHQKSSNMNDLGDGDGGAIAPTPERRSRYSKNVGLSPRPVSQELNNWEELKHLQIAPENPELTASTLSGPRKTDSAKTGQSSASDSASANVRSDKVIYAELDFQKPVGLNIM